MAEYIECRHCESPNCKGCNVYSLAIMLHTGKFDCLMDDSRTVNRFADVAPVRHGRWEKKAAYHDGIFNTVACSVCKTYQPIGCWDYYDYCPTVAVVWTWRRKPHELLRINP